MKIKIRILVFDGNQDLDTYTQGKSRLGYLYWIEIKIRYFIYWKRGSGYLHLWEKMIRILLLNGKADQDAYT